MNQETTIQKTIDFVKEVLAGAEGGHDWWHIYRVWQLSKHIARIEKVDKFVVELGALLHDIADSKFHEGDEEIGPRKAREFLSSLEVEEEIIRHIENIISNISFSVLESVKSFFAKSSSVNLLLNSVVLVSQNNSSINLDLLAKFKFISTLNLVNPVICLAV